MSQIIGNKLIDVNFVDETNYTTPSSDVDIVSVLVDANWGPCDRPVMCDSTAYRELYNPAGVGRLNSTMATVQRCFDAGASYLEILRLGSKESWKFFVVSDASLEMKDVSYSSNAIATDFTQVSEVSGLVDSAALFRLRYPGGFPMKVTIRKSARSFMGNVLYDIIVEAYAGKRTEVVDGAATSVDQYKLLESLQVSFVPLEANGQSLFYADVINSNSVYLVSDPVSAHAAESVSVSIANSVSVVVGSEDMSGPVDLKYGVADFQNAYSLIRSRDISRATLLVNSYPSSGSAYGSVLKAMSDHAEGRKDCVALVGFPTLLGDSYWKSGVGTDVEQITISNANNWFNGGSTTGIGINGVNMFTSGIVGWESYALSTVCGTARFNMDCTAAWAGRICAVAQSTRNRNQLPSYKAYGVFNGLLERSLSFNSVVDLHDNYGIGSVYHTSLGNYIFNIRDLYGATESYFARLNVMRVSAALLAQAFDLVEQVIHTDAAANRNSRLRLQSRLNSVIGDMQARGELQSDSYADVGDVFNSDIETHGGRYLNVRLSCHFIGLVERVNITVVATDSSVNAELSMG